MDNTMVSKEKTTAIAYLRTSSAANVGSDKDSDKRQRAAIEAFTKRAGYELVNEFYDAAVSGADAIDTRPGFAALLERIEGNGVRRSSWRRRATSLAISWCTRYPSQRLSASLAHFDISSRAIKDSGNV